MKKGTNYFKHKKTWRETFTFEEMSRIILDIIDKRNQVKQWEKDHPIIADEIEETSEKDMEKDNSVYGGSYREYDNYLEAIAEDRRISGTAVFELSCFYWMRERERKLTEVEKSIYKKCVEIRNQLSGEINNESA